MGKTGAIKHIHQYFKRTDGAWACSGIEGCTHYMPKNMHPAPAGRYSICWGGCEKPFQLAPYNMQDEKPMCDNCTEKHEELANYVANKLSGNTRAQVAPGFGSKVPNTSRPIAAPAIQFTEQADEIEDYNPDSE